MSEEDTSEENAKDGELEVPPTVEEADQSEESSQHVGGATSEKAPEGAELVVQVWGKNEGPRRGSREERPPGGRERLTLGNMNSLHAARPTRKGKKVHHIKMNTYR